MKPKPIPCPVCNKPYYLEREDTPLRRAWRKEKQGVPRSKLTKAEQEAVRRHKRIRAHAKRTQEGK